MLVHECLVGAAETAATPKRVAWVWQGCHTLLICEHLCNLWENILHHKLLWVLWVLWENSLVGSPNLCASVQSVGGSSPPETSVGRWFSGCVGMAGMPYPPNPQSVGVFVGGNVRFV